MKMSEIQSGKIYSNGKGHQRVVILRSTNYLVYSKYKNGALVPVQHCIGVDSFAEWAKEIVTFKTTPEKRIDTPEVKVRVDSDDALEAKKEIADLLMKPDIGMEEFLPMIKESGRDFYKCVGMLIFKKDYDEVTRAERMFAKWRFLDCVLRISVIDNLFLLRNEDDK